MMDGIGETSAGSATRFGAPRRRFDVAEYYRMTDAGILHEDDHIELIDGEIIEMAAIGSAHIGAVMALTRLLLLAAGDRGLVSVQNPLRLGQFDEPEPDVVLLRPRSDGYRAEPPPGAADALLVIEVADSSLAYDREVKRPLYARAAIPEYWIVDIAGGAIEVCRVPGVDGYAEIARAGRGNDVEPLALAGCRIAVGDVVPDDTGPAQL